MSRSKMLRPIPLLLHRLRLQTSQQTSQQTNRQTLNLLSLLPLLSLLRPLAQLLRPSPRLLLRSSLLVCLFLYRLCLTVG